MTRYQRRSRRKHAVRAKTEYMARIPKFRLRLIRDEADMDLYAAGEFVAPTTRGDCVNVPRPCPHVSCRHNLYLDVAANGSLKLNFPDREPGDMPAHASCALDVADAGRATIEQVGEYMNFTRERARQIEEKAVGILRMRRGGELAEYAEGATHTESALASVAEDAGGSAGPTPEAQYDDQRDALEAERFARIAATLVLVGYSVREAWDRANAQLEDVEPGDPLPALFADTAESKRAPGPAWVTPPERLREPPKDVESLIPRERAHVEFGKEIVEAPAQDGEGIEVPVATVTRVEARPEREHTGKTARILAILRDGPRVLVDLAAALGERPKLVGMALHAMLGRGLVAHDGRGAPWRLPGDERAAVIVARPKPPPKAKERICSACKHPESDHKPPSDELQQTYALAGRDVARVCKCGCEKFRALVSASDRRARDAELDALLEQRAAKRAAEEAEHAMGRCPAIGSRGRPCGRVGIHAGFCVVHAQRRERGIDVMRPHTSTGEETPMGTMREQLIEHLKGGEKTSGQLVELTGAPIGAVTSALNRMRQSGEAAKAEGYGAPWSLTGKEPGPKTATPEKPAKKPTPKAKTNGHAPPSAPAADAKGALFQALAKQIQEEHDAKMAALKVLLGG